MHIRAVEQTHAGVYKMTPDEGSAFFLRTQYLRHLTELDVREGDYTDEAAEDLLWAALVYGVEQAAMTYVARAEHCREGLAAKLRKKGLDRSAIAAALDYLESIHYIDDERFAGAWLRSRSINHCEGRKRLQAELAARGVDKAAATAALDDFFSTVDEMELCRRACAKYKRQQQDERKLWAVLERSGFSGRQIRIVLSEKV